MLRHTGSIWWICTSLLAVASCRAEPAHAPAPDSESIQPAQRPATPAEVYAPSGSATGGPDPTPVHAAFSPDPAYAGSAAVPVHRLVYRVRLAVPRSLGVAPDTFSLPAAELYLDVGSERLRARFVGDGWPVPDGSEVRIRRDQSGVYVFDGAGGRPLGPGQLASWFEGGRLRRDPTYHVRAPSARDQPFQSELLCRFIAEWSRQPPDVVIRRCGPDGAPPFFRVGLWRAERTADVSVELPRSNLRADEVGPPPAIEPLHQRPYLTADHLARMPSRAHGIVHPPVRPLAPPLEGLAVVNSGRSRAIITVHGVPIGWVDAGERVLFGGLRPGVYSVGAMRPLGLQTSRRHNVSVPATITVPY